MVSNEFIQAMPKVELHVHLEGSIQPSTLLELARRNQVSLPATTVEGLSEWYTFRDFPHFVEIYVAISKCIKSPEDIELIMREFLAAQAAQNIRHSEVTYTASTIEKYAGISWDDQLAALERGIAYGKAEHQVSCGVIVDIVRGDSPERARQVAEWVVSAKGSSVVALGIAGEERLGSGMYTSAYDLVHEAGIPIAAHSGETMGAASMREVLDVVKPARIGHGVRVMESPAMVRELAKSRIPVEVCPSSNVCLGVVSSLESHPIAQMLDAGINVSINSDDPPMFGTTLSEELIKCAREFGFNEDILWSLTVNALQAAFLPDTEKRDLVQSMRQQFQEVEA